MPWRFLNEQKSIKNRFNSIICSDGNECFDSACVYSSNDTATWKNEYGLYQTVASTISMLSILSLGFNSGYI